MTFHNAKLGKSYEKNKSGVVLTTALAQICYMAKIIQPQEPFQQVPQVPPVREPLLQELLSYDGYDG